MLLCDMFPDIKPVEIVIRVIQKTMMVIENVLRFVRLYLSEN